MKATEQLRDEHGGIKLMLRILGVICERIGPGGEADAGHLERILKFFTIFVDRCHHGKEEDLLFPSMVAARIPRSKELTDALCSEHRRGREYVKAMQECLGRYRNGEERAASSIVRNARDYSDLLLPHIDKEDTVLYPMADLSLPEQKHEELLKGFERIERERIGEGAHEGFHALMRELEKIYLG